MYDDILDSIDGKILPYVILALIHLIKLTVIKNPQNLPSF